MAVVHVVRDYFEELEADLLEFFGIDLLDIWRGRLSLRRVGVLINSLMRKAGRSTLLMAMNDKTEWTEDTYLLARISDAMETSNYLFTRANFEVSEDLPEPKPITRPGETEPAPAVQPEMSSPQEIMDLFGLMNSL